MQTQKSKYQATLEKVYDWLSEAAHQDVLTLMDVLEKAKAYLRAAEDLSTEELRLTERYLMRDFEHFSQQFKRDAEHSWWLENAKHKLWQLLGKLSDQNKVEMVEMQLDMAHEGIYHAGELVALGEMTCTACGHSYPVDFVEQIQPCIECGNETFTRKDPQDASTEG